MTRLGDIVDRNHAFIDRGASAGVPAMPRLQLFIVACIDPRVDPVEVLGLRPGDALVARNAGGRVTPEIIRDVTLIASIADVMSPGRGPALEVAIIHHTECGTGFLADAGFTQSLATRTGVGPAELAARAVTDPTATVVPDVAALRQALELFPRITVSGHVHDLATGAVRTIVDLTAPPKAE